MKAVQLIEFYRHFLLIGSFVASQEPLLYGTRKVQLSCLLVSKHSHQELRFCAVISTTAKMLQERRGYVGEYVIPREGINQTSWEYEGVWREKRGKGGASPRDCWFSGSYTFCETYGPLTLNASRALHFRYQLIG